MSARQMHERTDYTYLRRWGHLRGNLSFRIARRGVARFGADSGWIAALRDAGTAVTA